MTFSNERFGVRRKHDERASQKIADDDMISTRVSSGKIMMVIDRRSKGRLRGVSMGPNCVFRVMMIPKPTIIGRGISIIARPPKLSLLRQKKRIVLFLK